MPLDQGAVVHQLEAVRGRPGGLLPGAGRGLGLPVRLLRDRHGWWEIRGGALCLLWPPREDWECAQVALGPGPAVRFDFPDGTVTEGVFRE